MEQGFDWWFCTIVYGGFVLVAVIRAPWRQLLSHRILQHLFLGITVLLLVLWQMQAGLSDGLSIHFLGATMAALVFGWELGLISLSIVLAATTAFRGDGWLYYPLAGFVTCLVPVLVSYCLHLLVRASLPKNFFIYFLATVFLGAMLSVLAAALVSVLILWMTDVYTIEKMIREYLVFLPLMVLSEGVVNGMLMAGLMTNHPNLIRTFGAKAYIDGH